MENQIEIYKGKGNHTHVDVKFENETVWLSQAQITELFDRNRTVITRHINTIFKESELEENRYVQNLHIPLNMAQ